MNRPSRRFASPLRHALPLALAFFCGHTAADTAAAFNPKLTILNLQRLLDTTAIVFGSDSDPSPPPRIKRITADSAKIVSPPPRSTLSGDNITYEIEPAPPVDSVMLFVRHSQTTDTLGVLTAPPFKATWNTAGIPDQDQIHLQFGYVLYCPDSAVITSKPLPHRWLLDRGGMRPSAKTYRVGPMATSCGLDTGTCLTPGEGDNVGEIGGIAGFKLLRSGARLHFVAWVKDGPVAPGDFIELHTDMRRDRARFSGINHRSIRFSPLVGRRSFFIADSSNGAFNHADSVRQLLNEEVEWKATIDPDGNGYAITATLPFMVLSDLIFPRAKFGFDVTVMSGGACRSWSGAEQFARYSPQTWGTAQTTQAAAAIKYLLLFLTAISCLAVLAFAIHTIASERKQKTFDPEDTGDKYSPLTEAVIKCVEEKLSGADFCIDDVSKRVERTKAEVTASIQKDLDCTFDQLLSFRRIKKSQTLMKNPELSIDKIAEMCGFANVNAYREQYKARMNVDPEVSRAAALEKIREDQEAKRAEEED